MDIYIIRHTTPAIDKNTCYGQSDIDVLPGFSEEAKRVAGLLSNDIQQVFSSPLIRCRKLAEYLFPGKAICYEDAFKEINCGQWEMKNWDDIDPEELRLWMRNFIHQPYPAGENFLQFDERVLCKFRELLSSSVSSIAVITHAGVMRCILKYIESLSIESAFDRFRFPYGCLIHVTANENGFTHTGIQ